MGGKAGSSQGLGIGDGEEVNLGNIKEVVSSAKWPRAWSLNVKYSMKDKYSKNVKCSMKVRYW